MPSLARELQGFPYIPSLLKAFSADPSGGNFLVPARKLIRNRLRGALPKSRPPKYPPAALTNCVRIFRIAIGESAEKV